MGAARIGSARRPAQDEAAADCTGIACFETRPGEWEPLKMLFEAESGFLERGRVAHLATADRTGMPHVVPVCYGVSGGRLYITIDEKPKRRARSLKRLANILENPRAAVVVDRWDEDWTRLGWVMLRGPAEILDEGAEHDRAQALLKRRYPQLAPMAIAELPVIALTIERVASWGNLAED